MPQYTDNYGLIKPYETENYDVEVQNSNMDKIDLLIKTAEDKINVLDNKLEKHKEDYAQQRQQDQLKVAKVEKELNDYKATMQQININQKPKQKVSGYGTVSLPQNAANGQVSVSVKGRTLKQEFNYNKDTMEQWSIPSNSTKGEGKITLKGREDYPSATLPVFVKPNTKYGILYTVLTSNVPSFHLGAGTYPFTDTAIPTRLGNVKIIATTKESWTANLFRFYLTPDSTDEHSITISTPRMFELPPGSEIEADFNTLSADQLAQKYPYISGDSVKSTVGAMRLKSVGKNLFEPTLNGWIKDAGGTLTLNDSVFTYKRTSGANFDMIYKFFKVKPNTTYSASVNVLTLKEGHYFGVAIRDGHISGEVLTNFSSEYSTGVKKRTFTTLSDTICVILSGAGVDSYYSFKDFQIEEGAVATLYEPYRESNAYVIAKDEEGNILELRSLPNGTKDEIRTTERKFIKRVSEPHIIKAEDITYIVELSNVAVAFAYNIPSNHPNFTNNIDNFISIPNMQQIGGTSTEYNKTEHIGKYFTDNTSQTVVKFVLSKGTTLEQAKQQISGTTLIYQLAKPIEIPVQVSGTLISYPNGTVYIEPVVADAGVYTDKMEVLHQDLPIKAIEKVSKVDFVTGLETELDIEAIVIAENQLSFTHPDLSEGDIVFFEYEYDLESTQGETEIEYYDSRYVIKDSVTDKFYKWHIIVADGVPSIELVEV